MIAAPLAPSVAARVLAGIILRRQAARFLEFDEAQHPRDERGRFGTGVSDAANDAGVDASGDLHHTRSLEDFKFSSTQIQLPTNLANRLRSFGLSIPAEELNPDEGGLESDAHVTVKYGLKTNDAEVVRRVLTGAGPTHVQLGNVGMFEGEDADVVYVSVYSPDLVALNAKIAEDFDCVDTHPTYTPHATIAYLMPGFGKQYVGRADFAGETFQASTLTFSPADGEAIEVALAPKILKAKEGPLQAAADSQYKRMLTSVRYALALAKTKLPNVDATCKTLEDALKKVMPQVLLACAEAGGNVALGKLRAAGDVEGHEFHGNQWTHGMAIAGGHKLEISERGDTTFVHLRFSTGSASSLGRVEKKGAEYHAKAEDVHIGVHDTKHAAIKAVVERSGFRAAEDFRTLKPGQTKPNLNMRFDVSDPNAIQWAKDHAAELAKGISDTTRERIAEAIADALESGEDPSDEILAAVGDEDRADLIARTETMQAASEGQRMGWDQATEAGLLTGDEKRVWIATEGCCDECDALDGEEATLDGNYPGDGEDGPPLHPNCRCTEGLTGE